LARYHSLNRRRLIESDWYRLIFADTRLRTDGNRIDEFLTTRGGGCYARSLNDSVLGLGAHTILLDDPQTPASVISQTDRERANEIYDRAVATRLNDRRRGTVILATQRLHGDDLTAYLATKGFEVVSLPLIATKRQIYRSTAGEWIRDPGDVLNPIMFPPEEIEKLKQNLPENVFQTQYQQQPVEEIDPIVDVSWFSRFSAPSPPGDLVLSWDTAEKGDGTGAYSVCLAFNIHDGVYDLIHVARVRQEFRQLLDLAIRLDQYFRPRFHLIEAAASGHLSIAGRGEFYATRWPS
jgi:hypothetical protein